MGGVDVDPSGRPIPVPTVDIEQRISKHSTSVSLQSLGDNKEGSVMTILLPKNILDGFEANGLSLGSKVRRDYSGRFFIDDKELLVSDEWASAIFVQLSTE